MQLVEKLKQKDAVIGIIGLGYVGLPLALRYSEVGYRVLGFDIDGRKVNRIGAGESYINYIPGQRIAAAVAGGLEATTDFARAGEADALILCVPTPLDRHHQPDLSFIINTIDSLLPHMRSGQVVSLESTTYPGTTEEELQPRIEALGLTVGRDVFLVYSPEREDPGNPSFHTQNIPKVCGGVTAACLDVGVALYEQVVDQVVPVSSTRAAEMTKLLENIHRAVNIGLVNEMKIVADRMGIDIHEVIRAAATKPFGFVPYFPGPGLGGHCIPIDPFYLSWKAKEFGVDARFIELAGEVNRAMPEWVVNKVAEALNRQRKAINGSRIVILGIAYKKNVDDMRESPAVEIIELLQKRGATVSYSDPHIPVYPSIRRGRLDLNSVALDEATLAATDCVVLVTDHDAFNYDQIAAQAPLIVDARGRFGRSDKVIAA